MPDTSRYSRGWTISPCRLVVGRKHDPNVRRDLVVARVREIELLGIADAIVDVEPLLGGAAFRGLDQRRREVDSRHGRARRGRTLGDRARAGREVEPAVARRGGEPLDHKLVDVLEGVGDALVGAVAPHHALPLLQLFVCHRSLLRSRCPYMTPLPVPAFPTKSSSSGRNRSGTSFLGEVSRVGLRRRIRGGGRSRRCARASLALLQEGYGCATTKPSRG